MARNTACDAAAVSRKTIHDVARSAGVSIKTVSRVLNDEPNVRPETRARVLAASESLRYQPSLSARSLAGHRSCLLGLVYANPSSNYLFELQHGAMDRCRQEKFRLFVHQCSGQDESLARDVIGLIDQTHVDGLIVAPPLSQAHALIEALEQRGVPFVRIAPDETQHLSAYVTMDDEGAAREMTEYLIAAGHSRIGFIAGDPGYHASAQRLAGYRAALDAHGIPLEADYLGEGLFTFDSGKQAANALLRLRRPPTAIFASNDDMAAGVLSAAHERGIDVPRQLSVAGFDDTYVARIVWPRLTTVHQPSYELAFNATELLLQELKDSAAPRAVRLPHELVVRESTAPCAAQ